MKAPRRSQRRLFRLAVSALVLISLLAIGSLPVARAHSAQAKIKRGGSISVRDISTPSCIDPAKAISGPEGTVLNPANAALLSQDQHGKVRPGLALKWKVSKGGKQIDFFLRHNARFSSGRVVDASAVKSSFERLLKSPNGPSTMGPLSKVQVINKYQVRFIMKTPDRPVFNNLAGGSTGIVDTKAAASEGDSKFCQYPVLAGPFAVTNVGPSWSPTILKPNKYRNWEEPWQPNQGKPYLGQIVIHPISSDATAVSELLSGELDITNVPGDQLSRVQNNSSIKLHNHLNNNVGYLFFNLSRSPFDKPEVRKAFAEAIDRNAVIKTVLNGLGQPAYSIFAKTASFYDKNAPNYDPKYNPADAQKIFAANHITGPYTFLSFSQPLYTGVAELIQNELAQVGVKLVIQPKEIGAWVGQLQSGDYDISFNSYSFQDPDEVIYALFYSTQVGKQGDNFSNLKDPKVDSLIMKGRTTLNQKKAAAAYAQLQKYFDQNAFTVPLYSNINVTGVRSRVGGYFTDNGGNTQYQNLYIKH